MAGGAVFLLALAWVGTYSFLLFHSLVEISSAAMGWSIFFLAWNTRGYTRNNGWLLFLGSAYFMVGFVALLHTLSYKGMNVFPGYGTNLPTQFWIAARCMEGAALFFTPMLLKRRVHSWASLGGWGLVAALLLLLIFSGNFPVCHVEGVGLTRFKVVGEYVIMVVVSLAGLQFLYRMREREDRRVLLLLLGSAACTIGSELSFTFYVGVYDLSNIIGHYFMLGSFWLVYMAIVVEGLSRPLDMLFRDLKRAEALRADVDRIMRHDLRTPLAAFVSFPGIILEESSLPPDKVSLLKMMEESGKRMLHMLDQSRDLFKMENGEYEPHLVAVDMVKVARKALLEHAGRAQSGGVDTALLVDGAPVVPGLGFPVMGEEFLLYTALSNLVLNAIEAAPEGTVVRLFLERVHGRARVCVHNQGAVPGAVREHFFEKYATHGKRHGTGLGTYSVRLIVGTLGGETGMETSEAEGTSVFFTLPAA